MRDIIDAHLADMDSAATADAEHLVIQPLAPEAAEPAISRAAAAVRVLDDLGLVVRLV